MVSRKSKKTSKLTYAERIVCAVHGLQKSHRRGGVHLASIKTQVRKDAEGRRDKLGPQWAAWVTKAVNRLNENGLLLRTGNSFEFSPASKKILKESEQTLPVTGTHGEELLAKHLFRATASTKRPGVSGIDSTPTKKPRATLASTEPVHRSPWLKKKKAELVAEIERLQRERLRSPQVPSCSPSPLTDLNDNEDRTFDIDGQIFSSQGMPGMRSSTPEFSTRPSSPVEPDPLFYPSTPVRPHESLTRKRPLLQVTRTHSGSYIANGRPTPDPPEVADHGIHHDQTIAMDIDPLSDDEFQSLAKTRPSGLATPGPTPARTTSSHESIQTLTFRQMMANDLARLKEENKQLRAVEATQASSIVHLDAQIQSFRTTNAQNEERVNALAAETSTLQAALTRSTERCSFLDLQLSAGTAEIASLQSLLNTKDQQIVDFVRKLQDVNSMLEARTHDLNAAQSATAKLKEDLAAMKSQMDDREVELTSKLMAIEKLMEISSASFQQKIAELDNLHMDLQKAQESTDVYKDKLEALKAAHAVKLGERNTTIDSLRTSLSSVETTAEELRLEIGHSTETCAQLRIEVEETDLDRSRASEELAAARLQSASVRRDLDQALLRIREAEAEMEEMELLRSDDAASITKLRNTIEKIHAAHMEQWAGISQEVTQAAPAPRRPRFSV
ncbi:hypothetical protein J3R30DRAFT_3883715 [Lentinula aciculospora]|uniref:Uncharacterized protein n=1 Tax=Lentinula aciculospora TaxID=153920 RepID=A0A9W9AC29_9AGAR|nr:hypothetical protein J3R30DRAFT_3883715 [Lentinula aciculospora]